MIKVLYIIDDLMFAGAQKQLLFSLKYMNRRKFESYVVYFGQREDYLPVINSLAVETLRFPRIWRWDPIPLIRIINFIKIKRISIVHTHLFMSTFYGVIAAKIAGIPVVNQFIHTAAAPELYRGVLMKLLFPFSDVIVASSAAGRDTLCPNRAKCVLVINNMISLDDLPLTQNRLESRRSLGLYGTQHIIGMVANFNQWKDYPTFFRMAKQVLHSHLDTVFVCVGDGERRHEFFKMVRKLGIQEKVKFLGQRLDVFDIIADFDVGVLFSYEKYGEAQSFAIIEYMAMGKPVVASKVGGIPESVEDGMTGFLVRGGDYKEAASKVILLIENPKLARYMGIEGRKRVGQLFDARDIIKQLEELYLKLCEGRR